MLEREINKIKDDYLKKLSTITNWQTRNIIINVINSATEINDNTNFLVKFYNCTHSLYIYGRNYEFYQKFIKEVMNDCENLQIEKGIKEEIRTKIKQMDSNYNSNKLNLDLIKIYLSNIDYFRNLLLKIGKVSATSTEDITKLNEIIETEISNINNMRESAIKILEFLNAIDRKLNTHKQQDF